MRTVLRIFALVIFTGLLASLSGCTHDRDNTKEQVSADLQKEKIKLRDDLRTLRNDIDREIEKIDARLKRVSTDKDLNADRVELEKANRDLSQERTRLDKTLEDIENASEDSWAEVKVAALHTSQEVKTAFRKMGDKLEALFKEKDI